MESISEEVTEYHVLHGLETNCNNLVYVHHQDSFSKWKKWSLTVTEKEFKKKDLCK